MTGVSMQTERKKKSQTMHEEMNPTARYRNTRQGPSDRRQGVTYLTSHARNRANASIIGVTHFSWRARIGIAGQQDDEHSACPARRRAAPTVARIAGHTARLTFECIGKTHKCHQTKCKRNRTANDLKAKAHQRQEKYQDKGIQTQ